MEDRALLDEIDRRLLNHLQEGLPLRSRPFALIGKKLGIGEAEVLWRVRRLKDEKIIRQVSAIFDSARLGYRSCLVAAQVPVEQVEETAAMINRHPGVSHNYERNHPFNLWFTLTVPPGQDLQQEVARLQEQVGLQKLLFLPAIRTFKIGVRLDVGGEEGSGPTRQEPSLTEAVLAPTKPLEERDVAAVRALQKDIPLESEPFAALAATVHMEEEELLERANWLQEHGYLRRLAAVLYHRRAGFVANGMAVWNVPDCRIEEVGRLFASFQAVSHCYQRPRYPNWPYSLFTMVHARTQRECEQIVATMSSQAGITDYAILFSTREFKKERVRYFE